MNFKKTGILLIYAVLESVYFGKKEETDGNLTFFLEWLTSILPECEGQPEFDELYRRLRPLIISADGAPLPARAVNALRAPLAALARHWLETTPVRLYLGQGLPSLEALPLRKDAQVTAVGANINKIPPIDDGGINLLLSSVESDYDDSRIDGVLTPEEIYKWAGACYPMDAFDYDRLYLSGKLDGLKSSRKGASIVLSGSSYAMVGLREDMMPREAVNLAVNAQDPYYTFLSVERARENCPKIDTAVISSAYYFWHTDMSDNPSDYMRSVLTRVNIPIFGETRNYTGVIPPKMAKSAEMPLIEASFDLEAAQETAWGNVSRNLASLPYYNDMYNVRPANGMLQFPFREQSEEVNYNAARLRAGGHAGVLNERHVKENMQVFREFLDMAGEKGIKLVLFVPPVTRFYREHSSREMRDLFYEYFEPVRREYDFTFIDLFDSPDFTEADFQDYDHLNSVGAEKLSRLVAGLL